MAKKTAAVSRGQRGSGIPVWKRAWFPALVFALLSLTYFSEFVFSNKTIYGYDIGFDLHYGEGLSFGEKVKSLAQPQWNPQMGGFPQSEEIRPQYFPAYLIYLFTSYHRYLGWRYILTMFLAGWSLYLYLREVEVGRWAALWAGIAYMSAPTFLSFPYAGHYAKMGVIALFPLFLFFLERGLRRGRPIYAVGLGVAIAAAAYSPHPQMLYYALLGTGLYFLFRVGQILRRSRRQALSRAGWFALALALGLGLGAEGLFPSYLYARSESKRAGGEEGRSTEEQLAFARSWSLHFEEVGSLLVPEFGGFDNAEHRYYWGRNPMKTNSEYFGALVILLALLTLPGARRQPLVLFMAGLFVLSLAFALGGHAPVHTLAFYLLPGAKVLRTVGMSAFLFAFAACVLAGMGLQQVLQAGEAERRVLRRRAAAIGGVLTGLALLVAIAPRALTDLWIGLLYSDIAPPKRQILAASYDWLARGGLAVALVTAAGTALLYLRLQERVGSGLLIAGLSLLTLFDTWRIDRAFLQYEDPARQPDIRQENPRTLRFLKEQEGLFRLFPLPDHAILAERGFHLFGVNSVTGRHDFTLRRYDRLMREFDQVAGWLAAKYYQGEPIPYADEELLASVHPLLDLVNARYIAAPAGIQLHSEDFPLAFTGERYRLYANPTALPWFYLVPTWKVMAGEEEILAALREGRVDLRRTAILEGAPCAEGSADTSMAADRVELLVYDLPKGYIRLKTISPGPRLLVLSENYHPNWRAWVDGQKIPIQRANYVWQGICLPPGEHQVEWRYRSATLAWARAVTLLSLMASLGLVGWEKGMGRRSQRAKGDRSR